MKRIINTFIFDSRYRAVGLTFFLFSILFAFWVTRLPDVRENLQLSVGQIGIGLFFIPLGSLISMFLSHRVNSRFGEGKVMVVGLIAVAVVVIFPVIATSLPWLCVSLLLYGFCMGLTDISMNAVVSIFEKNDSVQIMAATHGFFSLGGIVGALIGSFLIGSGIEMSHQMLISAMVVVGITLTAIAPSTWQVSDSEEKSDNEPLFAIPKGPLIPLALIGFCAMMSEGAIADWSTIYLEDIVRADAFYLGFGYAAFSTTMTIGRFSGDAMIEKFGRKKIITGGCTLAILGISLVLTTNLWIALTGFLIIGAGLASIIPVVFSSAGNVRGISSSYGIAAVGSAGYTGFLIGPVLFGFIAEFHGLIASFCMLILILAIAMAGAYRSL